MTPAEFDAAISAVHEVAVPLLVVASVVTAGAAAALRDEERRLPFERSASWWVERHGVRPVARHRARGLVRAAVRRRVRRVVFAVAVLVDELTASSRLVTA